MKMNIIYEDKDVIVVEKPAGMPVQTGNIAGKDLVSELKNYLYAVSKRPDPYLGIIHRLDRPVRGILVFALNEQAAGKLSKQIRTGDFNKKYHAYVEGIINTGDEWKTLVDYLIKDKDTARIEDKDNKNAKRAELKYKTVKTEEAENMTLLDIELVTGRFHQIRAQLSNLGHPIIGDDKYGAKTGDADAKTAKGIISGNAIGLYAYHLSFDHPRTGKREEFSLKTGY